MTTAKLREKHIKKHVRMCPFSESMVYAWAIFRFERYGINLNSFSAILRDFLSNMDNPKIVSSWLDDLVSEPVTKIRPGDDSDHDDNDSGLAVAT